MTYVPATMDESTIANFLPLDNISDYGDFGDDAEEAQLLDDLLTQVEPHANVQNESFVVTDIEDYEHPQGILVPKQVIDAFTQTSQPDLAAEIEVLRDRETASVDTKRRSSQDQQQPPSPPAEPTEPDTRSPLERFRQPPKKALSVTDLVSPAWCELQYFYALSKHGRKRRTPAMKQGSKVHKALEDEVHITVPVETTKIEDNWGLRLWNICQGLKTLRETGRTRELEIWGTIGGELVNGIIDELSYTCPDPKYEETLKAKGTPVAELPEYQTSITEFLLAKPEKDGPLQSAKTQQDQKWVYLTDVKTRATPTLPTGSSLRPTIAQLHLYHHMLENLVQGNFSLDRLAERYDLNVSEAFSDSFLAQLGNLNQDVFSQPLQGSADEEAAADTPMSSQDSMDILLQHNTLSTLWDFTMQQFRLTFLPSELSKPQSTHPHLPPPASQQSTSNLPPPPSQPTLLSPLLTASYLLSSKTSSTPSKRFLGRKSFQFNPSFLHSYLSESLPWWRGEREAKGVALQEAWKCRSCDFRNECSWILARDQMAFEEAMERKKMREMAGVEGRVEDGIGKAASRSKV